jgi:uncharacterized repeat protein (TIGR03803 family)
LSASGQQTVLHTFIGQDKGGSGDPPSRPWGGVVRDASGNLYGTTEGGGAESVGTVYKLDPQGKLTGIYHYPGRSQDNYANVFFNAGVILDSEGNVYGTTSYGGVEGMIYRLEPSGKNTVLHDFTGAPGGTKPDAGVTIDSAGNFSGVTQDGGAPDWGVVYVVYKVDPTGHETALYTFTGGTDGAAPEFAPVVDSSGNLYGTTLGGG